MILKQFKQKKLQMKMQRCAMLLIFIAMTVINSAAQNGGRRPLSSIPIGEKYIALTFDDGPTTNETVKILDELKRLDPNAKVTFYINGSTLTDETRVVLQRAVAEGHDIDNHGYYHYSHGGAHPDSKDKEGNTVLLNTPELARENIQINSQLIYDETGYWPFSFRAPFFEWGKQIDGLDRTLNMPFVQAIYDSRDWSQSNQLNPEGMAKALLSSNKVTDGTIVLFHDAPSGRRQGTVDCLQHFIPQLLAEGYVFVTVRELFMMKQKQPELFMPTDTWNPNPRVPFNPDTDGGRYSHVDLWPDNIDNWWLQDWWTCSTAPWERDLSESCDDNTGFTMQPKSGITSSEIAISATSSKQLHLTVSSAGAYTVSMYNVNGKLLAEKRQNLSVGTNTLALDNKMSKGVVIVSVKSVNGNTMKKMVVK